MDLNLGHVCTNIITIWACVYIDLTAGNIYTINNNDVDIDNKNNAGNQLNSNTNNKLI